MISYSEVKPVQRCVKGFYTIFNGYDIVHPLVDTCSPQVERVYRSKRPMLAKLVDIENGIFWDHVTDKVENSLNDNVH